MIIASCCRLAEAADDTGWAVENAKGPTRALFLDAVAYRGADDANAEDER